MIFGLNFNGTQIPLGHKRRFAQTIKPYHGVKLDLKGVATSHEEAQQMEMQASRPGRMVYIVERKTAANPVYGVYCG